MLSFFFNRFSRMVLLMEALGAIFMVAAAVRLALHGAGAPAAVFFIIVVIEYAFIRYCASVRWYRDAPRGAGIELHFKKMMVPTVYILALVGLWLILRPSAFPLVIAALLIAVVAHVNVILITLHRRDRDPTPASFYSGVH